MLYLQGAKNFTLPAGGAPKILRLHESIDLRPQDVNSVTSLKFVAFSCYPLKMCRVFSSTPFGGVRT